VIFSEKGTGESSSQQQISFNNRESQPLKTFDEMADGVSTLSSNKDNFASINNTVIISKNDTMQHKV
jgi:hypothetical protein